uniref:ATP synthase F0 subunit 8 n=1 Tax=Eviota epiphanes TaxID=1248218 RepID=UPI0028FC8A9B|nr:ATP synthase F0 subunit 8 [Eviota epiphanes]WNH38215.1 ATP synthase F0 subunit 8 [Eviota epiphanes]
MPQIPPVYCHTTLLLAWLLILLALIPKLSGWASPTSPALQTPASVDLYTCSWNWP